MEATYKAKVSVRAGQTYCVRIPKKLVDAGDLAIGDVVVVSICKKVQNDSESNQE